MRALVTGGAGFIGCNLANRLAAEGAEVVIYDALTRPGVETNLAWLRARHGEQVTSVVADIRDAKLLAKAAKNADVIFHLAAQVAVTTSLMDPGEDFAVNAGGTLNVLEAARSNRTPVIFASTNKVYGDLSNIPLELAGGAYRPREVALDLKGVDEGRPLDFHTPYGCSKGAADQYVLDYARSYGLPTCVLRMSCIYGPRQMGTEDQGWVAHFLIRALQNQPISIYGDGRQVRDILYVDDAVDAYVSAFDKIGRVAGRAFNLGGGPSNAVSLVQLIAQMEHVLGRRVALEFADWRPGDQRYYVSDISTAQRDLALPEPRAWRSGVAALAEWLATHEPHAPRQAAEVVS